MSDRCNQKWGGPLDVGPHRGTAHWCGLPAGHNGGHQCVCGIPEFVVQAPHHETERENTVTNTPDSTAAIEALARRRLELTAKRDDITTAIAQVDEALMTLLQPGEAALIDGQPIWVVQQGANRWNEARARDVLPDELLDAITSTEPHIDRAKAKQVLPPALYVECCVPDRPHVAKARR
jgi:hypothetical protein